MLRTVVAGSPRDPDLAAASRAFWSERLALDATIVQRAIERGELPPTEHPQEIVEAVLAPIYFRTLVTTEPVDDASVQRWWSVCWRRSR